jgi:hypothetical protein
MQIRPVEQVIQAMMAFPPIECPVAHRFTPGLYIRTVFMPRGTFVVGVKYRVEHPFTCYRGKATVWHETGEGRIVEGPAFGVTEEGTRRYFLIHEDTFWSNTYPNPENEKDPDKIMELMIFQEDFSEFVAPEDVKRLDMWREKKLWLV